MTNHHSPFTTTRPGPPPRPGHPEDLFVTLRLTSSHNIVAPPAPHSPQFGGNGTTIGNRTVEFNAPGGIAPLVVSGVAVVDLDSAPGAPSWTNPEWIKRASNPGEIAIKSVVFSNGDITPDTIHRILREAFDERPCE